MSFIRTVLGDIDPGNLGVCYAHEHLMIDPGFATHQTPGFLLEDIDRCERELRAFHQAGGRAAVDAMPCDCGRNVLKLAEVSRRTGVHILCPTGLHLAGYYPPGHWGDSYTPEELAGLFVAEIEQGIDARDYGGPLVSHTSHRAGLIKIASSLGSLSAREERIFSAAAEAHRQTGSPILTHTEQGTAALEQVGFLQARGVDLAHLCLSHTDRKPDPGYHREILSTGVKVEYDSAFRWKGDQGNPTLDLLVELLPEFPHQIMLGMDAARSSYWQSYGGAPGLAYLLTRFSDQLRARGVTEEMLRAIFVETPAATFSFVARPKPGEASVPAR
ncbi:MAG: aryldialkylphosphatase [Verrucomicrobiota bacterium]